MKSTDGDDTARGVRRRRSRGKRAWNRRVLGLLLATLFLTSGGGLVSAPAVSSPAVPPPKTQQRTQAGNLPGPADPQSQRGDARVPENTGPQERAGRAPSAPSGSAFPGAWWILTLCAVVGAGAIGLLHWVRVRDLERQMEVQTERLREEKQRADAAADRADRLENVSERKSRALEELSHSFRTPLTLTLRPIDNLLDGEHGALRTEVREQLRLARRNGTRLRWLVDHLLDLAELETGSLSLAPARKNVVRVVARSLWSFEGLAERRDLRLSLEGSLDDPVLWLDEAKTEKILAALLSGAFRSADDGGTIRVTVQSVPEDPHAGVELVVENARADLSAEGAGEHALESILRGGGLRRVKDANLGVGIYLARELVDLQGGDLHMEGRIGEGVRFVVRLPRQPERGETPEGFSADPDDDRALEEGPDALALSRKVLSLDLDDEPAPSEVRRGGDPPPGEKDRTTVLVIDDNSVIRSLVRSHLEPDYRVAEAEEGVAGYNLAVTLLPDLVITDVMMPQMDGFELCQKIKQDPDVDHIPVILLTARADSEDRVTGLDVGADAYVTKPFEPRALIARVENLIATRRSLRESFRTEHTGPAVESGSDVDPAAENVEVAEGALPPTAENRPLKEQIEEAISEHLTDPEFEVSDLAAEVALSPSQLRRRMKEMYDHTPVQLIRHRRLEAGARLLRERPDATIGEVAYAVGFNSQSYFSRSFRDEFGTSPSQYRARHGDVEA